MAHHEVMVNEADQYLGIYEEGDRCIPSHHYNEHTVTAPCLPQIASNLAADHDSNGHIKTSHQRSRKAETAFSYSNTGPISLPRTSQGYLAQLPSQNQFMSTGGITTTKSQNGGMIDWRQITPGQYEETTTEPYPVTYSMYSENLRGPDMRSELMSKAASRNQDGRLRDTGAFNSIGATSADYQHIMTSTVNSAEKQRNHRTMDAPQQ